MKTAGIALVGDGIENHHNAQTMMHAAEMFGCTCLFRDTQGLTEARGDEDGLAVPDVTIAALTEAFPLLIGFDNSAGAQAIYGYRLPRSTAAALIVGNERRGLSREVTASMSAAVEIPMDSKAINCLNVAAASGVGLYYLTRGGVGRMRAGGSPDGRRPELLLVGGDDHVELGSAIRSACAFGWRRCLIDDPGGVWFGSERWKRAEGRAAARQSKYHQAGAGEPGSRLSFREVVVVNTRGMGTPLGQARLSNGPEQLIVIPDEARMCAADLATERFAGATLVHIELPHSEFAYHYRLFATIAMAEIYRQVGRRERSRSDRRGREAPFYDKALAAEPGEGGIEVSLEDLREY
ncbi:MAG: hypothetical protein IPG61_08445 [bacterium]|nr:hypothetical protein [bacterium]